MTPNYLKKVLPLLLNADLAGATNDRLLSLARAYVALYGLVSSGTAVGEYGTDEAWRDRSDLLFGILAERCDGEPDVVVRSGMVRAMYALVCETSFAVDLKKKNGCCAAADALVQSYMRGTGPRPGDNLLQQAGVCMCITDLLYPCPDADDSYLLFLKRQIAGWVSGMERNGSWPGVSSDAALERIAVMDRNSHMFLDSRDDSAIKRTAEYYRACVSVPADPRNFDENYLHTLGRMYDAVSQGYMCPADKAAARRIARFMYDYSRVLPERNEAWFYCSSYIIHYIAEGIEARLEAEIERHIA